MITGAGRGIGRAVALALHAHGYATVLAGRTASALSATQQLCERSEDVLAVATDVTDPASVAALFDTTVARFGRVDLLFNNAGSALPALQIDEVSPEQWSAVIAVNLTGSFLCAREAFRVMRHQSPRGGRIINNGSVSAHVPRPRSAAYTASKHAVTGLTRSIALDGRAFDIACGQIDIGNATTEMAAGIAQGALQPDGSVRAEPMMDAEDVAKAVLYMAGLPLSANVLSMTVMASGMPLVGRG